VQALDLIVLGRQLSRIGERAMRGEPRSDREPGEPKPAIGQDMPPGTLLVMRDVFAHPASSISDITNRTGLPQGYVSESVTRLRERGIAEIMSDPADGRRTLVSINSQHLGQVASHSTKDADTVLLEELGDVDEELAKRIVDVLAVLAGRLRPAPPGPVVGQIKAARSDNRPEERPEEA
jgi:DNA-binding MarR family transcriptional regulator